MEFKLFGLTDVGCARDHNEDNFAICKDLSEGAWNFKSGEIRSLSEKGTVLIVADGMGGTNAGEIASDLAQRSVKDQFNQLGKIPSSDNKVIALLNRFILKAHDDIVDWQKSNLDTAGMGTTLVIAWILNEKLYVSWSGDSRCYVFNANTPLYPFTDDHSHIWHLVKNNQLTPEQARLHPENNLITQNLGNPGDPPQPEGKVIELQPGDRVLLCSDGLNGMLSDAQIHYILLEEEGTASACQKLVDEAKQAGGSDNITVLLFDVNPREVQAGNRIPRMTTSYHEQVKTGSLLGPVLISGFVFVALLAGYFSFFKNEPHKINLGTKELRLNGQSSSDLELATLFLPDGPKISRVVVVDSPAVGHIDLKGNNKAFYQMGDRTSNYTDRFDLEIYSTNNEIFTATYKLEWKNKINFKKNEEMKVDSVSNGTTKKQENLSSTSSKDTTLSDTASVPSSRPDTLNINNNK